MDTRSNLLTQIPGWTITAENRLFKRFTFPNFLSALEWVNTIGAIAESEGHHPDLSLGWGYVEVVIYTHKINNLTESDFVLAAKFEESKEAS
jgi:4a-hydroxytetrahydrobiopterin dehydratase